MRTQQRQGSWPQQFMSATAAGLGSLQPGNVHAPRPRARGWLHAPSSPEAACCLSVAR